MCACIIKSQVAAQLTRFNPRVVAHCVAVCCNVLQCVAVCCCVLQCVAVFSIRVHVLKSQRFTKCNQFNHYGTDA